MNILRVQDTQVLSMCLRSLSYTFVYLSGVEYLKQRPHLFIKLFEIFSNPNIDMKKQLLSIFIGFCKCMKGAYDCINKAVINTSRR